MAWVDWQKYKNKPVEVVSMSGVEIFKNLKSAQKRYPDLDPMHNTERFTWAVRGEIKGKPAIRFETWEVEDILSR